ncbi:MAG: SMI1/KNR4 family protein [Solirubrobacterales bacterium]|nr:SMI1/KNR4 family protein [Solirubrobacterales bacterium]
MLSDSLERLLAVAGPPLGATTSPPSRAPEALSPLLAARDGFLASFSALHVFPVEAPDDHPDLGSVHATLTSAYGPLLGEHRAFAQDLFGVLFTVHPDGVCTFDPETAEHEVIADGLDGWAEAVLAEPEALLGAAFAFDWQERHGALRAGERLVPLMPFALGGEYDDANLEPRGTLLALRERGVLARTLAGLPDGAEVEWPLPGTREETVA